MFYKTTEKVSNVVSAWLIFTGDRLLTDCEGTTG
jgi:hypothetical protein